MLTEENFYEIAKARPQMMRAFYKAVNAMIDCRKEIATDQSGWWATARLKKKQLAATFLTMQFANAFVFNGQPISDEEKTLVQSWIVSAANFHMLSREDQDKVLVHNVAQLQADQAELDDIEVTERTGDESNTPASQAQQLSDAFDHLANADCGGAG